jgi:hypothetical protein
MAGLLSRGRRSSLRLDMSFMGGLRVGLTLGAIVAGLVWAPSGRGIASVSSALNVSALHPSADALVNSSHPTTNYGGSSYLRVRSPNADSPTIYPSYVTFDVGAIADVQSLTLRLRVSDPSPAGGAVATISAGWSEATITWSNAPVPGSTVASIGPTGDTGSWVSVTLPVGVLVGGQVRLALLPASSNSAIYRSRETSDPPELLVATTPTPAPSATATPKPSATPSPSATSGPPTMGGMLISPSVLRALPMSGAAWSSLVDWAARTPTPNVSDQDDTSDVITLAKALVYARTGQTSYRDGVLGALRAAVGTEAGGRTLAEARNLPGYVLAADLVDLASVAPAFDTGVFRPWLRTVLSEPMTEGTDLVYTAEHRPNNWGTHAGAARVAITRYLGDGTGLARQATVFRGWLGDRSAYAGFAYGDLSWQCDPTAPVGIDPTGCTTDGVVIDGALPDDMRRGGTFQWPPLATGYPWEALQGATLEAELLSRAGYPAWAWQNDALERAATFLYERAGWLPDGDDRWQPWLINHAYGSHFATVSPTSPGKNFGFSDWLYGG